MRLYVRQRFGLETRNLFEALEVVEPFSLFSREFLWFSHALRRLGNGVRHLTLPRVGRREVESAGLLLYFFLEHLAEKNRETLQKWPNLKPAFQDFLKLPVFELYEKLYTSRIDDIEMRHLTPSGSGEGIFHTATLLSLYAESRIWEGRPDSLCSVLDLLDFALQKLPLEETARLVQLKALAQKKQGRIDDAMKTLQEFYPAKTGRDDPESAGILASCFRAKWLETGDLKHLHQSYELYEHNYSKSKNSYVGINLAATCLYLGDPQKSRQIAIELKKSLLLLVEKLKIPIAELDLWMLATLAEAALLAQDFPNARKWYALYFGRVKDKPGMAETTRRQLERNLAALHLCDDPDAFLQET